MSSKPEITISATEFKAKCLDLMDRIAAGSLARVRVTKRGRVTAELVTAQREPESGPTPFHGFLKDRIAINPAFDWRVHAGEDISFEEHDKGHAARMARRARKAGLTK